MLRASDPKKYKPCEGLGKARPVRVLSFLGAVAHRLTPWALDLCKRWLDNLRAAARIPDP